MGGAGTGTGVEVQMSVIEGNIRIPAERPCKEPLMGLLNWVSSAEEAGAGAI